MNQNTRACIAYIVGTIANDGNPTAVYDYSQSKSIGITGQVSLTYVNIYDHDRGCVVSGALPELYDHCSSASVLLNLQGTKFQGHDYGEHGDYTGNIDGKMISIYDFGPSANFQYSV